MRTQMSLPIGPSANEAAASPSDVSSLMAASESSDAETVVSDIPLDVDTSSNTISEDSLNQNQAELAGNSNFEPSPGLWAPPPRSGGLEGHSLTRRLREIAASMPNSYETDTSEASLYAQPPRPHRRRRKNNNSNSSSCSNSNSCGSMSAMEEELRGLERRLVAAEQMSSGEVAGNSNSKFSSARGTWEDGGGGGFGKSLSTELFGNFTDNEKVCFSYENLARHALAMAASSSGLDDDTEQEELTVHHHNQQHQQQHHQQHQHQRHDQHHQQSPRISNNAPLMVPMPAPVESALKRMHPMRSSAPHEKYSPKPARRSKRTIKSQNSSSPSTPTSEHPSPRSPFFIVSNKEESVSMPPMGVTSMWIPSATTTASYSSLSRKVSLKRQSSAPHERYSPKPSRRSTTTSRKQNSSSPSTPTSDYPSPGSPFFIATANEESVSMPPMGVIPAVKTKASYTSLSRKVFLRRQSSGGGGGCGGGEMILPSKADLGDGPVLQASAWPHFAGLHA